MEPNLVLSWYHIPFYRSSHGCNQLLFGKSESIKMIVDVEKLFDGNDQNPININERKKKAPH